MRIKEGYIIRKLGIGYIVVTVGDASDDFNGLIRLNEPGAFLWQEAPAESDGHALVRLFETFMDSCDWWRARLAAGPAERSEPAPEMMIRP